MKNLKKGLAVAMALAMVTTVMPTMNVSAGTAVACSSNNIADAQNLLFAIKADLEAIKAAPATKDVTLAKMPIDVDYTWTETLKLTKGPVTGAQSLTDLFAPGSTTEHATLTGSNFYDVLVTLVDCLGTTDKTVLKLVGEDATETAKGVVAIVTELEKNLTELDVKFKDDGDYYKNGIDSEEHYGEVKEDYDFIVANYASNKDNMTYGADGAGKATLQGHYTNLLDRMKTELDDYAANNVASFSDAYVRALKAAKIADVKVDDIVNSTTYFSHNNLEALEKFIKDLKADEVTLKDGATTITTSYKTVAEEGDVADLVEGLEEVVADIKEVKDLIKSTNATVKDYKKMNEKMDDLKAAVIAYKDTEDTLVEAYEDAINAFRTDDIKKLTTYVEEVAENFFTVETIKRTNGNFSLRLKNAEFARYVTEGEVIDANLKSILTSNLVKDEEESVYEELTSSQNEVEKLLKAVAAIEDIKVGSTFTTAEAAAIVAAKKALNQLDVTGQNPTDPYGLTSKEKRAVKANAELIETLYIKLILSGTVTESGWIDLGNGNWDYINADGSKTTKWVAAGKDWYFVQSGHMLRNSWVAKDASGAVWYYVDNAGKMVTNTTIDGYVINANGEWHKK